MALEVESDLDLTERYRFRFEAAVQGSDGPIGTLNHVLLTPGTRCVTGLVIRTGFLLSRELRISLRSVVSASEDEVQVSLTADEARELQRKQARVFRDRRDLSSESPAFSAVGASREFPPAACVLSDGLGIMAPDGVLVGRLRQLFVAASSGDLAELIIETGWLIKQRRQLPAAWVQRVTAAGVEVEASREAVWDLPLFRGDRELRAAILDAWFYDEQLRPTFLRAPLDVTVGDGIATLEGYARSRGIRLHLEAAARAVPGIREVRGAIVTDDELVQEVISALGRDPRTRLLRPRVQSVLGLIWLDGEAPDQSVREAASEVTASVSCVREVTNRLRVGGKTVPGLWPVCCTHT